MIAGEVKLRMDRNIEKCVFGCNKWRMWVQKFDVRFALEVSKRILKTCIRRKFVDCALKTGDDMKLIVACDFINS